MGGSNSKSKSTTTNKSDITVVNKSDLDLLNKNVNDFVSNTVINQASNCSANISQLQNIDFQDITTTGAFVVDGVNQNQSAAITFDCVQLSAFQNDIANGVLAEYTNAIQNSYNTSALTSMTAAAQAAANNQFGTTSGSSSNSKSDNDYKFKSTNDVNQNIQNVVENAITNNMSLSDIQSCMAQVKNSQNMNFKNITAGNVEIKALSQTQAADLYAKCIQEKNDGNKISTQVVGDLGLTVATEATASTSASLAGTSSSEATNTGVFQSAGDGFASVLTGVGNMWGSIIGAFGSFGSGNMTSLYCCIIIVVLAIVGGVGYYFVSQSVENNFDDQYGGALVKFDTLKFIVLFMVFVIIIQLYTNQN